MKIHFITSTVPNSKFKLHRTRKFCRTYELLLTHCFLWAKTGALIFLFKLTENNDSEGIRKVPCTVNI